MKKFKFFVWKYIKNTFSKIKFKLDNKNKCIHIIKKIKQLLKMTL